IKRAREFFGDWKTPFAARPWLVDAGAKIPNESVFKVPRPVRSRKRRQEIAVTEFKHYLACPYRYYLKHVRELQAVDDSSRELDGATFGTLLHRVLGEFGRKTNKLRHSVSDKDILAFLTEQLNAAVKAEYGSDQRRPAICLQLEQARKRLSAFASCQAGLAREGWRIVYAESDQERELRGAFPPDKQVISLVGRIDRIDFHEGEQTIRILDYKTGDRADRPEKTHRKGDSWCDLQLPLYRHLWHQAVRLAGDCTIELG